MSKLRGSQLRIGTAGWNLARDVRDQFSGKGSLLQRYAGQFHAVEINSSFYRHHLPSTYQRWAAETPADFRFSVKLPKQITHELRLENANDALQEFFSEVENLGEKLGVILIQLPPSLAFDVDVAKMFLREVRVRSAAAFACEPRHATWFHSEAESLLQEFDIARVAADPAVVPAAAEPAASDRVRYFRLHGSPRTYYSNYSEDYLIDLRERLERESRATETWCIFDNTAEGCATRNALSMLPR